MAASRRPVKARGVVPHGLLSADAAPSPRAYLGLAELRTQAVVAGLEMWS